MKEWRKICPAIESLTLASANGPKLEVYLVATSIAESGDEKRQIRVLEPKDKKRCTRKASLLARAAQNNEISPLRPINPPAIAASCTASFSVICAPIEYIFVVVRMIAASISC
jgi:hypothetical protein